MSPQDFLHTNAPTPLTEHFHAAGAVCSFSTNCGLLLEAARNSFSQLSSPPSHTDFSIRFSVDDHAGVTEPPWPKPYVRGVGHLVFTGFDAASSMLADLRRRRVIGRFSADMARDPRHWRMVIFPMLMSVIAGSAGLVELHASCIAKGRHGLLLLGPSRSGKSTLAMALIQAGFRFLSDDRTFCSLNQGRILAHALPRPLKLRAQAGIWFDDLRDQEPTVVQGEERVFHCEPDQGLDRGELPGCEPKALIFLERQGCSGFRMNRILPHAARVNIEKDLMEEATEVIEKQDQILDNLLAIPCWHLRYGGTPQTIAEQITSSIFENSDFNDSESSPSGGTV